MNVRNAEAVWTGNLREGKGTMRLGSNPSEWPYTYASRFEEGTGTNPEELIGAAHAGCYSMALSGDLTKAGFPPNRIQTRAEVTFDRVEGKATITQIHLITEADVPKIDPQTFQQIAEGAKTGCPVSRALAGTNITLDAKLANR